MPTHLSWISLSILLLMVSSCSKSTQSPPVVEDVEIISTGEDHMKIHGRYVFNLPCDTSHYITVPVQVNKIGPWDLSTDSINGLKFSGSGEFASIGRQEVKLFGHGSPNNTPRVTFTVKIGSAEAHDTLLPMKGYLDMNLNGTDYLGLEYPDKEGIRFGPQYANDQGTFYYSCEYYQVPDPLAHFQMEIDYRGTPSYYNVPEPEEWQAFAPGRYPIADLQQPDTGFKFVLKYITSSNLSTANVVRSTVSSVDIISRGKYTVNIATSGGVKPFPVYVIKLKFSARLANYEVPSFDINGEAIAAYVSLNSYR